MLKTGVNVIKSSDVKFEGEFQVDIDVPTGQPAPVPPQVAAAATPQVVIVENNPEYALIELTCACGAKSRIQCRYDMSQPPANPTE